MAGTTLGLSGYAAATTIRPGKVKRVGMVGLDTSHSQVFTRMINELHPAESSYRVTVAYQPPENRDIIGLYPKIADAVSKMGVKLVNSMEALLAACDVVMLETVDGVPHLDQALEIFKAGKRTFIDKPLSATRHGAQAIVEASEKYGVPFFSSSSLRFDPNVQQVVGGSIGRVLGADVFTPAKLESQHLDMAWYAIHGLEMLYTTLGPGCKRVSRIYTENADLITGIWNDGRMATIRGVRNHPAGIAGTAFGEKGTAPLGPFSQKVYLELVKQILSFFDTGIPPVSPAETLEMFAFMHAADESRRRNGVFCDVDS